MKIKPSLNSGFSLIELLVVLLIIGILSLLAYAGYYEIVQRSRLVQVQSDLRDITIQVQQYRIGKGDYPPDNLPGINPSNDGLYPITFPYRENYFYDYDRFNVNCIDFVKVIATPRGKLRKDPYQSPGIMGNWLRTGEDLSYTINARRSC